MSSLSTFCGMKDDEFALCADTKVAYAAFVIFHSLGAIGILVIGCGFWVEEAMVFPLELVDSSESDYNPFTGGSLGGASSTEDDDTDRIFSEGSFYEDLMVFSDVCVVCARPMHRTHTNCGKRLRLLKCLTWSSRSAIVASSKESRSTCHG